LGAASRTGTSRLDCGRTAEPVLAMTEPESPAAYAEAQPNRTAEVRDPYARWCGRGGVVRRPPIPICVRISTCQTGVRFVGRAGTICLSRYKKRPSRITSWRGECHRGCAGVGSVVHGRGVAYAGTVTDRHTRLVLEVEDQRCVLDSLGKVRVALPRPEWRPGLADDLVGRLLPTISATRPSPQTACGDCHRRAARQPGYTGRRIDDGQNFFRGGEKGGGQIRRARSHLAFRAPARARPPRLELGGGGHQSNARGEARHRASHTTTRGGSSTLPTSRPACPRGARPGLPG
jgi:hypothetical protein